MTAKAALRGGFSFLTVFYGAVLSRLHLVYKLPLLGYGHAEPIVGPLGWVVLEYGQDHRYGCTPRFTQQICHQGSGNTVALLLRDDLELKQFPRTV